MSALPASATPASRLPEFVLIGVTAIWGATFLIIQITLRDVGPFSLVAHRFLLAAAVIYLLFRRRVHQFHRSELIGAALVGGATFASYAFQTMGLLYIPSSRSAFITAMYVPAVPLLQLAIIGRSPRLSAWLGIAVSFIGLLVLFSSAGLGIELGTGELLTLGCALGAALQIVFIGRFVPETDPLRLAFLQFTIVGVLSMIVALVTGESGANYTPSFIVGILSLGIVGTAFNLGAMNWAQQTVSATRATVIYTLEPVWAGLIGAAVGEPMTTRTLAGSALIIAGVLVSEVRWGALLGRSPHSGTQIDEDE